MAKKNLCGAGGHVQEERGLEGPLATSFRGCSLYVGKLSNTRSRQYFCSIHRILMPMPMPFMDVTSSQAVLE